MSNEALINGSVEQRMLYEFFLANLVYIYLLVSLVWRYYKNKDIAKMKKNKRICSSLRIKRIVILLWAISYFFIIIITILIIPHYETSFWLKNKKKWYCFLYMIPGITLITQFFMMKYEYFKKLPYAWYTHYLFWIITLLFHVCFLINTHINQCSNNPFPDCLCSYLFDILRIIFTLTLTIYSFFKFQDLTTGQDYLLSSESKFVFSVPERILIESNEQNVSREESFGSLLDSENNQELKFRLEIKNKICSVQGSLKFFLNLSFDQKKLKLQKSIDDFLLLDQQVSALRDSILLKKDCPPLPTLNINFIGINQDFLAYRPIFESYLKVFLENGFYPSPLIEFLELEDPYKTRCIKTFHKKFLVDENALGEEEKENYKSPSSNPSSINRDEEGLSGEFIQKKACLYFDVKYVNFQHNLRSDYFVFIFSISLIEKPEEIWQINKRYSDFVRLNDELTKILKVRLPELPEKKLKILGSSPDFLEKRGRGLELYLSTLLNEKAYMKENRILFEFVGLSNENYRLIKEAEVSLFCKRLKALFLDQKFIVENHLPHQVYIFRIGKYQGSRFENMESSHNITKKFEDFEKLHKVLEIRFKQQKNFPSLPSRNASQLEFYLNELFKVENIDDSLGLRRFLELID